MRASILTISLLFFCAIAVCAQEAPKYLHISTNPSYADAYVNETRASIASNPDVALPGYIRVPEGEPNVLVTIFKPGYKDTTISVKISQADTSYLIVALTPSYDDELLQSQQKSLMRRARRNMGHKFIFASAVPLIASGIAAIVAHSEIKQANERKESIEKSLIRHGEEYEFNIESFNDHRDRATTSKSVSIGTAVGGAILLGFGIVLSF
ncbi:MAG: hypothetical protein IK012_12300 [Fibrobacter sp.]|uniref:hypothetical protein n=1 Tax=Fibrobacter sp. TaxID=35828 RepID=UPI0025C324A3|nr:hypothetical protein [Fibrobacter sp.]MBR4786012.1 hypothetical protein [Fibrobacter sp.]